MRLLLRLSASCYGVEGAGDCCNEHAYEQRVLVDLQAEEVDVAELVCVAAAQHRYHRDSVHVLSLPRSAA